MENEKKEVDLYCRCCRKSLHVRYACTGNPEVQVLENVTLTCTYCTRAISFHGRRESLFMNCRKDGRLYV